MMGVDAFIVLYSACSLRISPPEHVSKALSSDWSSNLLRNAIAGFVSIVSWLCNFSMLVLMKLV